MVAALAKGIGSLAKQAIRKGINQKSPAYKSTVEYVGNYLKKNKFETDDDVLKLMGNLRNPTEEARLTYKGRNIFGRVRNLINRTDLDDKTKLEKISIVDNLAVKNRNASALQPGVKEGKDKFFYDKHVQALGDMEPHLNKGIVDAYREIFGEGSTGTRWAFRNKSWPRYADQIKKDKPDLYNKYKDIIASTRKVTNERQNKLKTGKILTGKDDWKDYKYQQATAQKNNPKFYDTLMKFRDKENNPGLRNIYDELSMTQLHPAGMSLGAGSISKIKNLGSKYEMIPPHLVNKIRYPQYMGTPRMNRIQSEIELGKGGEDGLIDHLVDRWEILGHKFTPYGKNKAGGQWTYKDPGKLTQKQIDKIKNLDDKIAIKKQKADKHGIEIEFYNPVKKDLDTWGSKDYNIFRFIDEARKGNRKDGGLVEGYAGGGLIKKGIQKLLDSTTFNQSRRKFLKQASATAAYTATPKSLAKLAPTLAQATTKEAARFAPPWIKSMMGVLDQLSTKSGHMSHTMANGTKIKTLGGTADDYRGKMTPFEVTNSDGYKVPVNVYKDKKGNIDIEFDIRDDFSNNQHIYMDKKTGQVEIVDENYYMTSPEDYTKDDPLTWDVTTPTQMQEFEKKMGLMRGDGDDYIKDYMSTPEGGDYSDLFESFIDSFSPSGNIFHTKAKAKELIKKKIAKQEMMEMDWESQFRGGNIHGYRRGGTSMRDYPQRDTNKITPKRKPPMRQPSGFNMEGVLDSMAFVESTNNPRAIGPRIKGRNERAHGMYQILPSTARKPGYNVPSWTNFSNEWDKGSKSRDFARSYLQALLDSNKGDWNKAISQYGGDSGGVNYWNKIVSNYKGDPIHYNKGGTAEKFSVDDAVAMIRANPQSFVGGGLVKKMAPKVLGKLTNFKPKITSEQKFIGPTRPNRPFTVFDDGGLPIKDFNTRKEATDFIKDDVHADMYKVYTVGTRKTQPLKPEQPGAMFWGSREKIIGAPSESMTGDQWLQYMQLGKHGILNPKGYPIVKHMELNDTGLATHLSRSGKKTISKEQLVKDFDDKLAPDIDVAILGGEQKNLNALRKIDKINLQEYREGPLKNVFTTLKNRRALLEESISNNNKDNILKNIDAIENSVFENFGVAKSITEGFPQKFPFELKKPLQDIAQVSGARLAGFKKYARDVSYRNQQTLGGGENYREFLFRSNNKPGSTRAVEPVRAYDDLGGGHFASLSGKDKSGGFAHMRTSDRTDEFGRRVVHIEEIQSDMHQPINAAARKLKKKHADWAKEGKTPEGEYAKMSKDEQKEYNELISRSKYAPRGDVMKEVDDVNEDQLKLISSKIEELSAKPQTKQTQVRIARLNRERAKVRKIIEDKRAKMAEGEHSNVPQGPLSKTEDYNEFVMKYATKVAQEGGYDGVTISSAAIKNRSLNPTNKDYMGNVIAYGPMAEGAMKKAAKKSGAKFIKTAIIDDNGKGWEVPMIWLDEASKFNVQKGLPIYKRGGIAVNGR